MVNERSIEFIREWYRINVCGNSCRVESTDQSCGAECGFVPCCASAKIGRCCDCEGFINYLKNEEEMCSDFCTPYGSMSTPLAHSLRKLIEMVRNGATYGDLVAWKM